jgi:4-hydroxybenzoate polyprenyltransferase
VNYSEKSKSNFDVSQKQVILIKSFPLMNDYLNLIRLHQWVKNLFLFVPAFFGGVFFNWEIIQNISIGFFAFSFVASAIYILNDYKDIEKDRLHPEKRIDPWHQEQ